MDNIQQKRISDIKLLIDETKEYLENNLCKKCEEMQTRINQLEMLLNQYTNNE